MEEKDLTKMTVVNLKEEAKKYTSIQGIHAMKKEELIRAIADVRGEPIEIKKKKLIVISRRDLSAGAQAVQAGHSLSQFVLEHPQLASSWQKNSNYLIYLSVQNEAELLDYTNKFQSAGIRMSLFKEPDFNNEATAIAVEPRPLYLPRRLDPGADRLARLSQPVTGQLVVIDARHLDADVDAV